MKLRSVFIAAILIATCVAPLHVDAAPKVARRSVLDYFRLLPQNAGIFEGENRESLLGKEAHLLDLRHDYFQATGDGAQPSFQLAIFRHRGRDLVVVSSDSRVGDFAFKLWRYENKKWRDVTLELSPLVGDTNLHFVLPRYGTTIQVFQPNGAPLAKLYWESGRFSAESLNRSNRP